MFKSASRFMCGIRLGKGSSLKRQKQKEDWLNGVKEVKVKKKHDVDPKPKEKMPEKPNFVKKTLIVTKEERSEYLLAKLKKYVEHLQSETIIVTKTSKGETIRNVNDLINKIANLSSDKETKKIIADAKHAVKQYCKRPSSVSHLCIKKK